jgi:hypothetical protein
MHHVFFNTKILISTRAGQTTAFHLSRDYETVKIEQEVPNEFLLVIDRGDTQPNVSGSGEERLKGAYYKNIERKMTLKKRRTNVSDHRGLVFLKLIAFLAGQ